MDRAPADLQPPVHSLSPEGPTSRANRLRRSSRTPNQKPQSPGGATSRILSQTSPGTHAPETRETAPLKHRHVWAQPPHAFNTPTRMARSKYDTVFCVESPNNDGEFQQDIVWDANSPSPVRPGKKGKSRAAGAAIGISEIVRRIAPMHGRPAVVEPALQVWIESAAIPCTPEEHHPKRKSPRPNGVDDLLKLAKQFDFNMFRKDEERAEEMHKQALGLLSDDILEGPPRADPLPPAPETASKNPSPVCGLQDYHMEDFFDQPTQDCSSNLIQMVCLGSLESSSSGTAGRAPHCAAPPIPTPAENGPAAVQLDDDWENDWENEDFLNDTLVMEITPNPPCFAPPKYCSTQSRWDEALPGSTHPSRGTPGRLGGEGGPAEKEPRMPKNRTTFKLDVIPLSLNGKDAAASQASMTNTPQSEALSRMNPPVSGSYTKRPSHPPRGALPGPPAGPQPKTSLANANASAKRTLARTTPMTSNKMKENQPVRSSNIQAMATISCSAAAPGQETPPVVPASDDYRDLDELFSSEPVWDEEGDDDLLCQMCEDLETQAVVLERPAALKQPLSLDKKPGQATQRPARVATPPRVGDQQKGCPAVKVSKQPSPSAPPPPSASLASQCSPPDRVQPSGLSANPYTGNALPSIKTTSTESFKYALLVSNVDHSQCYGGGPPPKATAGDKGQFSVKKPPSPSVKVIPTGPKKCSKAEIERKKRQALERRRQHLQGPQNLGAPTRGR
ncbi:uncharacterized protein LOC115540766 [Gadus morhua]|uniref:Uncharacterized LOC115540766 n=1 Tax=Gadus morhua TaxID=8049 RepID=A0A8C5CPQ5_GADMO|nr:uncharacterized protein LOC115540766 [Gadus morhua]